MTISKNYGTALKIILKSIKYYSINKINCFIDRK